jgi:hypothetical protein
MEQHALNVFLFSTNHSSKKETDWRQSYVMTTFDWALRDLVDKSLKKVSKPGRLETEAHLALV